MPPPAANYVHALRFELLTGLYDPVVRLTTRERTFKRRLLGQAALEPQQRVLDLGCGTGTLAIQAAREAGASVTGVDGDPAILERARRKAAAEGVEVPFDEGLADALPYADGSFDKILSTLLFHHLTTDVKVAAAREVARVLRPGGELHLADFGALSSPLDRALFMVTVRVFDGIEQTRANVEGRLPAMLQAGGLVEVRERSRLRVAFGRVALYSARRVA